MTLPLSAMEAKKNFEWVDRNRLTYAGMWVALKDGEMIAAFRSRRTLERMLHDSGVQCCMVVLLEEDTADAIS